MQEVEIRDLQSMAYGECWDLQRSLFDALCRKKLEKSFTEEDPRGTILLVEHPAVYTLGKSGNEQNMLVTEEYLKSLGAEFYHIDRGGDITFHGPGQLVCYPIIDLDAIGLGVRRYIEALEQSVIDLAAEYGISNTSFGLIMTIVGLIYGLSRFLNGLLADRMNGRWHMSIGLLLCVAASFAFGFSPSILGVELGVAPHSLVVLFGVLLVLNNIFQGSGFPPCARLLSHWIPPHELATKQSIWNTSHSIGASILAILCGFIIIAIYIYLNYCGVIIRKSDYRAK